MNKLYLDLETTGFSQTKNGVVEIACIPVIHNEEKQYLDLIIKPFPTDVIAPQAMAYNGIDIDEGEFPEEALDIFVGFLDRHTSSDNRKWTIYGWNTSFDVRFLKEFFNKCNRTDYDQLFEEEYVDFMKIARKTLDKKTVKNHKQETIAEHFNIQYGSQKNKGLRDIYTCKKIEEKLLTAAGTVTPKNT